MKKIFNFETFKDYILSLFKISLLCNVKLIFINLYNHINVLKYYLFKKKLLNI